MHTRVLIVGGGPAGAVAGATLARAGVECTLMERLRFPRYHIGESLLPSVLTILEAIGLRDAVENYGFVKKYGGVFRWGPDPDPWRLIFGELEGRQNYAFQVIRSEFDDLLLRHAAACGVHVLEDTVVREVDFSVDGRACSAAYRTGDNEGRIAFDFLIDASGRYGLLANHHLNSRLFHPAFDNVAVWRYWRGGKPTPRVQGGIITEATPHGWLWYIPLHDGTTSVGAVMSRRSALAGGLEPAAAYDAVLSSSRVVSNQLEHATVASDVRVERDYSYHATSFAGPGYFMAGDAACFIDPVLSSGVHLATMSGLMAGACIQSVLLDGFDETDARRFYETSYQTAFHRFLAFLSAFYDENRHVHSYFWERQGLTERDCSADALRHAFVRLVTGTQDFLELTRSQEVHTAVQNVVSARIAENIQLRNSSAVPGDHEAERSHRFVSSVEGLFPTQTDEAVNGAVLELFPRVRLRAVSSSASIS